MLGPIAIYENVIQNFIIILKIRIQKVALFVTYLGRNNSYNNPLFLVNLQMWAVNGPICTYGLGHGSYA